MAESDSKAQNSDNADARWYADGLRFECTACGDCCTGAPGYVWLNRADSQRIADHLNLPREEFEAEYARKVGVRLSLIEFDNGDCVFFDSQTRRCRVYEARPRQCRTWPFWESNLRTPAAWRETCAICPGSGKGKLHQLEHIDAQRAVVRV